MQDVPSFGTFLALKITTFPQGSFSTILVNLWAPFGKHVVDGDSILEHFWLLYAPFSMLLFHFERVFGNYYTRLHQKHVREQFQSALVIITSNMALVRMPWGEL